MKPLLPSLKEKKRYILFEIITEIDITKKACSDAINRACLKILGELGCAKAGIIFLGENYKNNKGILRVVSKYVDEVKLALATIEKIDRQQVIVNTVKISGNVSKLK